jgi:hypothetical protein
MVYNIYQWEIDDVIRQVELESEFIWGRASISVSMPACHAGEQGSTPWRGALQECTLPKMGQHLNFAWWPIENSFSPIPKFTQGRVAAFFFIYVARCVINQIQTIQTATFGRFSFFPSVFDRTLFCRPGTNTHCPTTKQHRLLSSHTAQRGDGCSGL